MRCKKLEFTMVAVPTVMLAACTVGPDYVRPSVDAPAAYKESANWKPAEPRDDALRGDWWEMFGDPQLNALVEQVDISNWNIRTAEANFRASEAVVAQARASFFPVANANASVIRSRSPSLPNAPVTSQGPVNTYSASLNASWVPDLWGQVRRQVESNVATAQASAATLQSARLAAQASVAQDYLLLRIVEAQKQLLDDTVAAYQRTLALTQNRYAAGVAAKVDVVQAETQLKSAQAQAIDLGVQRAQLEHAIAILLGKAPAEFSIPAAPLVATLPDIPTGVPSALLERRPDIAAAERTVAAANAQIGVAKSAFFPALTLSGVDGYRSSKYADWFMAPSRFWSLGASAAQILFDGGLRSAVTNEARARYDADLATYQQTVLAAFQQVEDNLATLRILEREAEVQAEAVKAARESVILTTNQYQAGIVSYINVVAVQTVAFNNESTAMGILGRRFNAAVLLIEALGGGWDTGQLPTASAL